MTVIAIIATGAVGLLALRALTFQPSNLPTSQRLNVAEVPPPLTPEQKKEQFRRRVQERNQLAQQTTSASVETSFRADPNLLITLAKADADLGNYAASIESLERALREEAQSEIALYGIALYHSRLMQFAEGEKQAKELIALAPQNPDGYIALSWVTYRMGKKDAAVAALRRATERTDLSDEARFRLAVQYTKLHDPAAAATLIHQMVAARPDFQQGWAFLGAIHLGMSQTAEARRCLQRAIALNERDPRAHTLLGQALLSGARSAADLNAAQQHLQRALALDPRDAEAHLHLAVLFQRQRRWADAAQEYAAALRLNSEHQQARYAFARVCARLGRRDLARQQQTIYRALHARHLERARLVSDADARPPSLSAWLALARFHARNGDYADAIEWTQKACALAPRDPQPQRELARLLKEVGWEDVEG